jgi:hypothetical protein
MTRHKTLQCVHEPFGDAYYFGPERLAERYESDPEARKESGYSESTYRTIFDRIAKENSEVCVYFSTSNFNTRPEHSWVVVVFKGPTVHSSRQMLLFVENVHHVLSISLARD